MADNNENIIHLSVWHKQQERPHLQLLRILRPKQLLPLLPLWITSIPAIKEFFACDDIWSCKYCVLEECVLYFYMTVMEGASDEAIMERAGRHMYGGIG